MVNDSTINNRSADNYRNFQNLMADRETLVGQNIPKIKPSNNLEVIYRNFQNLTADRETLVGQNIPIGGARTSPPCGDNFSPQTTTGFSPELLQAIKALGFRLPQNSQEPNEQLNNTLAIFSLISSHPELMEIFIKTLAPGVMTSASKQNTGFLKLYMDSLQSGTTRTPEETEALQGNIKNIQGYNAKKGLLLKQSAEEYLKKRGSTVGKCARGVNDILNGLGVDISRGNAAGQANKLAKRSDFKEISVDSSNLASLPPGAIVVWRATGASPYGHISIATGDGKEISDHQAKQMTALRGDTKCRVFIPV